MSGRCWWGGVLTVLGPFRKLIFPRREGEISRARLHDKRKWVAIVSGGMCAKTGRQAGSGDRTALIAEPPAGLSMEILWDICTFDHSWDGRAIFASIWYGSELLYKLFSEKSIDASMLRSSFVFLQFIWLDFILFIFLSWIFFYLSWMCYFPVSFWKCDIPITGAEATMQNSYF